MNLDFSRANRLVALKAIKEPYRVQGFYFKACRFLQNPGRVWRLFLLLSALLLTAKLVLPSAWASDPFVGITGLEARSGKSKAVQVLEIKSDFPFQYQLQRLDKNRLSLRLYHSYFAENLLGPEGDINLLTDGGVQSAIVKKTSKQDDYQTLILVGEGLSRKKIQVIGGTERLESTAQNPVLKPAALKQSSLAEAKLQASKQFSTPGVKLSKKPLITFPFNVSADLPPKQTPFQPAVVSEASQEQPIKTNLPTVDDSQQHSGLASSTKITLSGLPEKSRILTDEFQTASTSSRIPLLSNRKLPIQAVTLDNEGRPIVVYPKSQSIPVYEVGNASTGYNMMFQDSSSGPSANSADVSTNDVVQRVQKLMTDALKAYQAHRFSEALQQVQQAVHLQPNNAHLYAALGEIQLKRDEPEQSETAYLAASQLLPESYEQRYAQVLILSGKRQQAVAYLEKIYLQNIKQQNPKQVQFFYMLGTLHEEMGHVSQALQYLKQAALLHPASGDIQYNLGLAYELSGDLEQAENHYRQALNLTPDAADTRNALARVRQ